MPSHYHHPPPDLYSAYSLIDIEKQEDKYEQNNEEEEREENDDSSLHFEDIYVGRLVDVIDFLSKWTNAIVTNVDKKKEMIQIVVDGGLEMELTKTDIVSFILLLFV